MAEFVEVCALWWNTSKKDGKKYLSGSFGPNNKVMLFPNQFKKEDKHPDYKMFMVKKERKEDQPQDGFPPQDNVQAQDNVQPSLLDEEPVLGPDGLPIPF